MVLLVTSFSVTLAGCDATGGNCMSNCGWRYSASDGWCGLGGEIPPAFCYPTTMEVTGNVVTCDAGAACLRFSFSHTIALSEGREATLFLDRVTIRSPSGGMVTVPFDGTPLDPHTMYPIQGQTAAYPYETGTWAFTFYGELSNDRRDPVERRAYFRVSG